MTDKQLAEKIRKFIDEYKKEVDWKPNDGKPVKNKEALDIVKEVVFS